MKFAKRSSALIVVGLYVVALASADQTRQFRRYVIGAYPKVAKAVRTRDFHFFELGAVNLVHRHLPGQSNVSSETDFSRAFRMNHSEPQTFDVKGNRRISWGSPDVQFIDPRKMGQQ